MKIKLNQILPAAGCDVHGPTNIEIKGISYDSRKVKEGFIFVALEGKHFNGSQFIKKAINSGAVAFVTKEYLDLKGATQLLVKDPLIAMAELSSKFYQQPDKNILLFGVTGTNGKTTITYFLESIFEKAKRPAGVIGTINYRFKGKILPAPNTTPQSADIYDMLNQMVKEKRKTAIMEVSSHALALNRIAGLEFDTAVFTNLTRDHLDFHETMENYFEAKSKLFTDLRKEEKDFEKNAVINIDDPWGKKLLGMIREAKIITYGFDKESDVRAESVKITSKDTKFRLLSPYGNINIKLSLLGQHNVYNALASAAASLVNGVSLKTVKKGLEGLKKVPGRLEIVKSKMPFTVVVDYAHTDDALHNVLNALCKLNPKRIITIFGCGGDRDKTKRPLMGDIATSLSDFVFVTSDNPRSEQPEKIALDIEVGIRKKHKNNYRIILDREQAIASAVAMVKKGDILLIAGKGHENYQIIGDQKIHFNDTEIAKKYLKNLEKQNLFA